jgi:hypothetical protein
MPAHSHLKHRDLSTAPPSAPASPRTRESQPVRRLVTPCLTRLTALCRGGVKEDHSASYFSHSNEDARRLREQLAIDSLEMLISWPKEGGAVGLHGRDTRPTRRACR